MGSVRERKMRNLEGRVCIKKNLIKKPENFNKLSHMYFSSFNVDLIGEFES